MLATDEQAALLDTATERRSGTAINVDETVGEPGARPKGLAQPRALPPP